MTEFEIVREEITKVFGEEFAKHFRWFIDCLDFDQSPSEFSQDFVMVKWNWATTYGVRVIFSDSPTRTGWYIEFQTDRENRPDDEFKIVQFRIYPDGAMYLV